MTPLLRVDGVRIAAGPVPLVHGLDFAIAPGEFVAMVGESGSGKTLAGRALLRLLPAGVRQTGGAVWFDGLDTGPIPDRLFRRLRGPGIGMVFQEPMTSLNPALTVGTQMTEALRLHRRLGRREAQERAAIMLDRVGIARPLECLRAHPHEFSGGMRQRIAVASAMLLRPRVLVADEPTTALDTLVQRDVLDLMAELAREAGSAVLLITHNLGLVGRYASRALVMQGGRLVEEGAAGDVLRRPQHPYTRRLVAALPRRGGAAAPRAGAPLLQVRGLEVVHRRPPALFRRGADTRAVDGVDLDIHEGEVVALVGGSGSGKTTLGRAVLQLLPYAGTVRFAGVPLGRGSLRAFRMEAQLVFQDPYSSLDPRMRVGAIVAEPLRLAPGLDGRGRARRVAEVLASVGLDRLSGRFPHELSGGQRQRVAIARALVRRPRFVVADEPVSALDMTVQAQVLELFGQLQREHGFACLFISHDLGAVARVADRVVVMQAGRVVEEGARDQVLDAPRHPYTRALLEASPGWGLGALTPPSPAPSAPARPG